MTSPQVGSRKKLHCNSCQKNTNHELKFVHNRVDYEQRENELGDLEDINNVTYEYRSWVCLGCDTVLLEEFCMFEHYIESQSYTYYPKRTKKYRNIKPYRQLDPKMRSVYREIITAYNEGLLITCSIGLRALLERICVTKGITDEVAFNLSNKLKKLEEMEDVPANIINSLYTFKFMGDAAAHRLESPRLHELDIALDILDDLLNFLYELEYSMTEKAQRLSRYRPKDIDRTVENKAKKSSK